METDSESAAFARLPDRFDLVFEKATMHNPHEYQKRIACGERNQLSDDAWMLKGSACNSMLIDAPTGFGKTSAVVLAWLWNRAMKRGNDWPRRLVYCLPMRTLVEQTVANSKQWVERLRLSKSVSIHKLMGGEDPGEWDTNVEQDAILVGTQEMLISRALNRGYGMSPYRWPMHFGLLNNDCLWIMDEVQLMGSGLWTSAQLDWMRDDRFKSLKPCSTWWMSATISGNFLETLDRKNARLDEPKCMQLQAQDKAHELFQARRPCDLWKPSRKTMGRKGKESDSDKLKEFTRELSDAVIAEHITGSLSLVVCNTVAIAQQLFKQIKAAIANTDAGSAGVVLLTSRFRASDRKENQDRLFKFELKRKHALIDDNISVPGLICVCTQVIEVGIDVSARRLWSEIAPWSSTVQRLGRLNRDGCLNEDSKGFFWESPSGSDQSKQFIGPYEAKAVKLGRELTKELVNLYGSDGVGSSNEAIARLSRNEQTKAKIKSALTAPLAHYPRAIDVHGLFSTEPDVFGGFTDVSPFIRTQDKNADATVFWRDWESDNRSLRKGTLNGPPFSADEGCAVPVGKLSEFLKGKGAWIWNDKLEAWEPVQDVRPGMLVLLRRTDGGYSREFGWTGNEVDKLSVQLPPGEPYERFTDDAFCESGVWVALGDHLNDTEQEAERIVKALNLNADFGSAVICASSEHDIGKSLTPWQNGLPQPFPQIGKFWAKAPFQFAICSLGHDSVPKIEAILRAKSVKFGVAEPWGQEMQGGQTRFTWHTGSRLSRDILEEIRSLSCVMRAWTVPFRPGFRHEAASAMALWHRYYQYKKSDFPALSIYLCAAHHGKIRTVLRSRNSAEEDVAGITKSTTSLPWKNMKLDFACAVDGASGYFTDDGQEFIFSAPGWTGLVSDLLGPWEPNTDLGINGAVPAGEPLGLGPFALAYLETLVRCADERASKTPSTRTELV